MEFGVADHCPERGTGGLPVTGDCAASRRPHRTVAAAGPHSEGADHDRVHALLAARHPALRRRADDQRPRRAHPGRRTACRVGQRRSRGAASSRFTGPPKTATNSAKHSMPPPGRRPANASSSPCPARRCNPSPIRPKCSSNSKPNANSTAGTATSSSPRNALAAQSA